MASVLGIREMVDFIKASSDVFERSATKAQIATIKKAEVFARKFAQRQFIGRNYRRLSGILFNSIYSGYERTPASNIPTAFLSTRNIQYGAIHEFGGDIEPKKAKHLWIPQHKHAGKMTPRDFIRAKERDPASFFLNDNVAARVMNPGSKGPKRMLPLFFLVDRVRIPERPYLRPAVDEASDLYPQYFEKFLSEEVG